MKIAEFSEFKAMETFCCKARQAHALQCYTEEMHEHCRRIHDVGGLQRKAEPDCNTRSSRSIYLFIYLFAQT